MLHIIKHGSGEMMIWVCFVDMGLRNLANIESTTSYSIHQSFSRVKFESICWVMHQDNDPNYTDNLQQNG